MKLAKSAGGTAVGGVAKLGVGALGSFTEAGAASNAVKEAGGSGFRQAGAFISSLGSDVKDSFKAGALGLTRNLLGDKGSTGHGDANPHSWRQDFLQNSGNDGAQTLHEHLDKRKQEGAERAQKFIPQNGA
jgi:hypothetical protein